MVIQLGFGDRCTRVQVQSDFVQLFQRLDLAVLDQLRDLVHSNIGLRETGGQGQGSGGEQGGQGFHGLLSLGERFEWDQVNCGNLIQP